jgi:hypothetical protein
MDAAQQSVADYINQRNAARTGMLANILMQQSQQQLPQPDLGP